MENKNWRFKLGLFLVILSCLFFILLLLIPFLSIDGKTKLTVSTIVFIIAEITFWSGGFLLGKEFFSKYKSYFNPRNWFSEKAE